MTGEAFEYAIKKDVRNNPIVREIDRERHRQMWRSSALGLFMVAVLMLVVWRHTDLLHQDVELQKLEQDLLVQQKDNDALRLQIERMRATARINDEARRRLGMVSPGPDDWQPIERVIASPQPPSSVLARR
jgi:cell division protein FtsL